MEENRSDQRQTTYPDPQYDPKQQNAPYGQGQPYQQPLVHPSGQAQPYQQPLVHPSGQTQPYQQPLVHPSGQTQPYQQPLVHPSGQAPYQQPYQQPLVHPSGQAQPYGQPARATVYDTMPMKNNNMAISGLVFGIFGLLGFWAPMFGIILSVTGLVCSAIGISRKSPEGRTSGMSVAGLILSIIALILGILTTAIYFLALMSL